MQVRNKGNGRSGTNGIANPIQVILQVRHMLHRRYRYTEPCASSTRLQLFQPCTSTCQTGLATIQGQDKHENRARAKCYRFATTRNGIQGSSRFCGGAAGKFMVFKFQVWRRSTVGPLFTGCSVAKQFTWAWVGVRGRRRACVDVGRRPGVAAAQRLWS